SVRDVQRRGSTAGVVGKARPAPLRLTQCQRWSTTAGERLRYDWRVRRPLLRKRDQLQAVPRSPSRYPASYRCRKALQPRRNRLVEGSLPISPRPKHCAAEKRNCLWLLLAFLAAWGGTIQSPTDWVLIIRGFPDPPS